MSDALKTEDNKDTTGFSEAFSSGRNGQLYRAFWRWHFYTALVVIPFLLIAALSGILMLLSKPVDSFLQRDLLSVEPQTSRLPAATLLAQLQTEYPDGQVLLYQPPLSSSDTSRFSLTLTHAGDHVGHGDPGITVFQNPYTGEVLGSIDPTRTIYNQVKTLHGTLFLGNFGDYLIEIAAGFAILMVLSGLYLAWPRQGGRVNAQTQTPGSRESWRNQHRIFGFVVTIPLLFLLISGLAWTNVWGGKLVQVWSSLPGTNYQAADTHESMNHDGMNQTPWVMEQTPMPMPMTDASVGILDLDDVVRITRNEGFDNFRVHMPEGSDDVWTVSATTIAGDIKNPTKERTIHIDPNNGQLLADYKFQDYPAMGKAMSAFIPLHQGDLGLWNLILNLALCALILFIAVSGITLWWKRRPAQKRGLRPPAAAPAFTKGVVVAMVVVSFAFPLSAAALLMIILIDWMLFSRVNVFRAALK